MKRGLELEPVAAVEYQDLTSFPCGFVIGEVIDPSASPAWPSGDQVPQQRQHETCFARLKVCSLSLKTTHTYFFQLMGQMGITGLKWCDLFVKSSDDHHLERVHFQPKEWENMKCKLETLFFSHFLPAVCNKIM